VRATFAFSDRRVGSRRRCLYGFLDPRFDDGNLHLFGVEAELDVDRFFLHG
jgi:hypothetical protein